MGPSTSIAHYRITAKLGEGGMGAVYRATDTKLNRDVAIKLLPDSFAADPDRLARFTRESQVLASLNHPNIAAVYGVEDRAIVMELVEGRPLQGPIPLEHALPLIHQLIDALEYAHEKGVVHRDLKPANILITPEGRLKILDFGLAKALSTDVPAGDPRSSPTLTMRATLAGAIMGTAAYMAPEQARGLAVDKRADIWAFAVVVCEILTGALLFDAPTVADTLSAVLAKPIDLSPIPDPLRPLLTRCLERDPRRRLRDIGDAPLLMQPLPTSEPPSRRSRAAVIFAVAAVLAACVFAGLWLRTPAPQALPYRFTLESDSHILFSPDARWMVSLSGGLRVRSLQGVQWRNLPGTEGATDPFWSPDSTTLGFFAGGRLRSISIDGTNSRNLAPAPDPGGGSWRGGVTDGTILFAAARRLQTLDLRSGTVTPLPLRFSEDQAPVLPVFCPEGNGFVYGTTGRRALYRSSLGSSESQGQKVLDTSYGVKFAPHPRTSRWHVFYVRTESTPGIANRTLMTAAVDPRTGALTGEAVPVVDAMANWVGTFYASFDVASTGLLYWRNTTPSLSIWRLRWFDRNGNVTGAVGDAAGYASMALSPDESRVAVLQGYPDQHIWVYNLKSGTGVRVSAMPGSEGRPIWSPDGGSLYYTSQTDAGSRVIRQSPEAGSAPEVLYSGTDERLAFHIQAVTPDNRSLILTHSGPAGTALLRLDLSGSPESRHLETLLGSAQFGSTVRLTPDGRTIVIATVGKIFSCRYPPAGESPRQIAAFPASAWPFFSPDGRQIYVISGQSLYSLPVLPSPDGGIRVGERSLLFRILHPARADANIAAISRDGNRILAISADSTEESRLQLITDWTSLVRR